MSDAPERIWAWEEDCGDIFIGEWATDNDENVPGHAIEFVRADIHDALVKERDALKTHRDKLRETQLETLIALEDAGYPRRTNVEAVEALAAERDTLAADKAELLAALEALDPFLDRLVCYASTVSEHEPNRIVRDTRTFLARHSADVADNAIADMKAAQAEVERLREQLAYSDQQAEKIEALLEPHIAWEGEPTAEQARAEALAQENARLREGLAELLKCAEEQAATIDGEWGSMRWVDKIYADGDMPEAVTRARALIGDAE